MILVGCDGCKLGFRKNECAEVFGYGGVFSFAVDVDDVEPGLVPVHRVENNLVGRHERI